MHMNPSLNPPQPAGGQHGPIPGQSGHGGGAKSGKNGKNGKYGKYGKNGGAGLVVYSM